jgi:hypothetical protein
MSELPHPTWLDYERHGDKEILATDLALFFRSTFIPSLATALAPLGDTLKRETFADRPEMRLKRRLTHDRTPARHLVSTLVAVKRGTR